jgi:class 3 adenylate cyclase/tetratricopeptide (TPR) repeat protein
MNCPSCGFENAQGQRFCGGCGQPLGLVCPSCAAENPPGFRFCGQCGTELGAASADASSAPERSARDYTPKHLADKILQSKSALEGERKQVTVLFADVKGSMELAEQVDPEEWHGILDRFFQILADGVHRFEGTVNQYTGDGIMALFGAPIAHEDHAQRACYAALNLRDELRRYADELRRTKGLNFSVRMGLNSGDVVVGKIGTDLRMDYTAQGHTVGLAQRIEQLAPPESTCLTDHTVRLVEGYFQLRDMGLFELKGVQEPLRVYELEGIGQVRTRLDVARTRGFSRFVGRGDELRVLESALKRAEQGSPQVVGIVGEAGVGKSRLCFEFLELCRRRGIRPNEAQGVAHGKSIPLLPIRQLFRGFFGIMDQDEPASAREKIAGRLLLLDEQFRAVLPLVFEFLGVTDPEDPPLRMEAEAKQQQLLGIVKHVVQLRAQREPMVTLLEDLHWFDPASDAFLEALVDPPPDSRRLVVVNFRPEYQAAWTQKPHYQQVALLPLGPEAIVELLVDLLGSDPSLTGLPELIREKTGGNPFFIEEVVRELAESAHLEGARGAYRVVKPVTRVTVPDTVQGVLAARIDRLAEGEKQLLQTAAVVGKTFSEPILERAAGLTGRELAATLHSLKEAGFIYEQALYPVAEYSFRHPLTQDVAYASQLRERRMRAHAAVADAVELLYADQLDEQAALIAHHREVAGEHLAAARWAERAAEHAGLTHPGEALRLWLKVRSLLREVPRDATTAALGVKACTRALASALMAWISDEEAADLFEEGKEFTRLAGDSAQHAFLIYRYAIYRGVMQGATREWIDLTKEALRLAGEAADPAVEFYIQMGLSLGLNQSGRLREALALSEQALQTTDDPHFGAHLTGRSPYLYLVTQRARARVLMGRLAESEADFDRAVTLARENGYLNSLEEALHGRIERMMLLGEPGTALTDAEELLRLAEQTGSPTVRFAALSGFSSAHSITENAADAASFMEASSQDIDWVSGTSLVWATHGLVGRARLLAAADRHGEARVACERAIDRAHQIGLRTYECLAQITLSRALRCSEGAAAATVIRSALARARELVQQTEARVYEPMILEEEARLQQLEGDEVAFEARLREAHRLYAEMGATGHAERVAIELDA